MTDKDLIAQQEARDAVEAASFAFSSVSKLDQASIDAICDAMSQAALANAERLGKMANEETGFGKAEDKREKNRFAAQDVWNYFRDLKTVGVVRETKSIVEIASPRGVVAAIIPSTNPTSTAIYKIIISIKSRNTIFLAPHPSAVGCSTETARIMRDAAIKRGLPGDAIICLSNSTIEGTETLMKHKKTAVILATGGTGLVRAAYSSGKPAFGVGPGNVPVYVDRSADVPKAAADIVNSKAFDCSVICATEQAVVADKPIAAQLRAEERCDASFIGSGQYPHRWSVLTAGAAACDLRIWGANWDGAPATLRIAGGPVVGPRFAEVVGASAVDQFAVCREQTKVARHEPALSLIHI